MTEQELQRQRDHEEDLIRLRGFRPIDDTFMRVLFRDNLPLAEYVLRLLTGKPDLRLTKEETQKDLVRLVGARGLCLDVHGVDAQNREYDLEVQRADGGARPERARYHASALDVENLDAGQQFEELPTTYIIFITENDIWGAGQALYPIGHINMVTGEPFEDRQHILYANASYKGEGPLGQLMHDFLCSDPDAMLTPALAEKTRFLKSDPKGVDIMCKIMEDLREESMQRGFEKGLEQGLEKGLEQGREEGLEQGLVQARIENIKSIMDSLQYTAQQAMDLLKIPVKDRSQYMERL